MKCVACYTTNVRISIQEKKLPQSCMLISNKANDTESDLLEKFNSRVIYRLRKVMHAGEQRQETKVCRHRIHSKKLYC